MTANLGDPDQVLDSYPGHRCPELAGTGRARATPMFSEWLCLAMDSGNPTDLKTLAISLGAWAARHPEQMLELTDGRNLITRAIRAGQANVLNALAGAFGEHNPAFRREANRAMRELMLDPQHEPLSRSPRMQPVLRDWLDAETANALLASTCQYSGPDPLTDPVPEDQRKLHGFVDVMVRNWAFMPQYDALVDAIHRTGAELDTLCVLEVGEPHHMRVESSMLHHAVEVGSGEMVARLLQMGCDPRKPAILTSLATGTREERDCFALAQAAARLPGAQNGRGGMLGPEASAEIHQGVVEVLRAWQAQAHARGVMHLLANDHSAQPTLKEGPQ